MKYRGAIVTGAGGQDGSYLCELLLSKGYKVYGLVRRASGKHLENMSDFIDHPMFQLIYGDMTDHACIFNLIQRAVCDEELSTEFHIEFYNLAAQSHVQVSFELPVYTTNCDALATLCIMDTIVRLNVVNRFKFYQASTSELFGSSLPPQSEQTPLQPRSPYAISKLYAYWTVKMYREAYSLFAINGILFNHESERRGELFVSRKITKCISKISKGSTEPLRIGNMYALRDWGYAKDYVDAMWRLMQLDTPHDLVIATGKSYTIKHFIEAAFHCIGVELVWEGEGINEKGYHKDTKQLLVVVDERFFRPTEVNHLQGDPSRAKEIIGWEPTVQFEELVHKMVKHDVAKNN